MSRYGHAAELQATQPPLSKLDFLLAELKAWADLNSKLRPLHAEFVTAVRQLHEAASPPDTDPALLERAAAMIEYDGRDGAEAAKTLRLAAHLRRGPEGS